MVATLALFGGYVWYTRTLVDDIRQDTERLATLYARALHVSSPEDAQLLLFEDVIQSFPYPVILTDAEGNPTAFKNLDLEIDSATGPWSPADRFALRQEVQRMDRVADPTPVFDEQGNVVQWIHVAEAGTITLLRYLPYIQALAFVALGLIAFWLIRYNLRIQRSQVWVAMARESAHQLGTPISSLYGWVELLRMRLASQRAVAGGAGSEEDPPVEEIDGVAAIASMEQDLDRLTKVANRFELIGRKPRLEPLDPRDVLREVESYTRARLPRRGHAIRLETDVEPLPKVRANRTLLEWALENLVKNAVDALQGRGGTITLRGRHEAAAGEVVLEVADDGPGVPRALRKRIFETGVSTKEGGWGVGLSLSRRIVEEYHDGSLELAATEPSSGATFRIGLPAAKREGPAT
ncbi:MAG: HAMP domain-containing sensor histidine kinase [Gemmatimonadota bacterium]|nr:HAMP domain-containing sensor histidine kinase [Gemmatimonadota bacterium]